MSRTDVLRFVDQNVRIAADQGAQDAGLFYQCAVAPVAPEVVCIGTYLSKTMHKARRLHGIQPERPVVVRVAEIGTVVVDANLHLRDLARIRVRLEPEAAKDRFPAHPRERTKDRGEGKEEE